MTVLVEGRSAAFEKGDYLYLVSAVAPFEPADNEVDEFSFADSLRKIAPNENIMWLRGTYVEADGPNSSGQEWRVDDISIKSLTPVFMPVTVMHQPQSAVGLIADTKLVLSDEQSGTRRSGHIDNTLAIWKHRFPDIASEVSANYKAGTLMQSQECQPAYYDCGVCSARFPRLPGHAERSQWCEHLRQGEVSHGLTKAHRIFGNVTFTGTGLIFGTRGARGALDKAKLEVLQDEVAMMHEEFSAVNRDSVRRLGTDRRPAPTRRTSKVDIEQSQYEALVAKAAKTDELSERVTQLETEAAKVPDLEKKVEELEVDNKKAKDDLSVEVKKREDLEEQSRAVTLASDRTSKLGKGFTDKLPESIKAKLDEQAKTLSDEDWSARLEELSELVGVKHDDAGEGRENEETSGSGGKATFSKEETSRSATGGNGNGGSGDGEPSRAAVGQVVGGLLTRLGPQRQKEPAAK